MPQMRIEKRREQLGGREGAGIVPGPGDAAQPHGLEAHKFGALGQKRLVDVAAVPWFCAQT